MNTVKTSVRGIQVGTSRAWLHLAQEDDFPRIQPVFFPALRLTWTVKNRQFCRSGLQNISRILPVETLESCGCVTSARELVLCHWLAFWYKASLSLLELRVNSLFWGPNLEADHWSSTSVFLLLSQNSTQMEPRIVFGLENQTMQSRSNCQPA